MSLRTITPQKSHRKRKFCSTKLSDILKGWQKYIQSNAATTAAVLDKVKLTCILPPAFHHTSKFHHVHWSWCQSDRCHLDEAKVCMYTLKSHGQNSWSPVTLLMREAKTSYVYWILKPHGQSSTFSVRLLPCEAKLSYIYLIWKPVFHYLFSVGPKQLCELVHLRCTWEAGTF